MTQSSSQGASPVSVAAALAVASFLLSDSDKRTAHCAADLYISAFPSPLKARLSILVLRDFSSSTQEYKYLEVKSLWAVLHPRNILLTVARRRGRAPREVSDHHAKLTLPPSLRPQLRSHLCAARRTVFGGLGGCDGG